MKKKCIDCERVRAPSLFDLNSASPDGLNRRCKDCMRVYREANRKKINQTHEKWRKKNRAEERERFLLYRELNSEKESLRHAVYRTANADDLRKKQRRYRRENIEEIRKKDRIYREENKEVIAERKRIWRQDRLNDPNSKCVETIKSRIRGSLNSREIKTRHSLEQILGCSFRDFKKHIEKQFKKGMSWDNYGTYWEYDHICPVAQARNKKEAISLQNYKNFQPLTKPDNSRKSNGWTPEGAEVCIDLLGREWAGDAVTKLRPFYKRVSRRSNVPIDET